MLDGSAEVSGQRASAADGSSVRRRKEAYPLSPEVVSALIAAGASLVAGSVTFVAAKRSVHNER